MEHVSRRQAFGVMAGAGTGVAMTKILSSGTALAKQGASEAPSPASVVGGAFGGKHQPRPLLFKPSQLRGLSSHLIESHWENNYSGAVKALNAVEVKLGGLLRDKDLAPYMYADLKREQLLRIGSVVLHELYFENLGGDGTPSGDIAAALATWFSDLSTWDSEFRKIGNGLAGGSGWVVLGYNAHLKQLTNNWAWDHAHNAAGATPLLVMDMYEHAYHMDYGAAAAKYVDAFMANVNWEVVNERYVAASKAGDCSARLK